MAEIRRTSPSAVVRDDLDTEVVTIADASTVELLAVCIGRARDERGAANGALYVPGESRAQFEALDAARREFSLAITHMEDAITRFNKGTYLVKGTFAISDAERS